jgi:hypothetical protein
VSEYFFFSLVELKNSHKQLTFIRHLGPKSYHIGIGAVLACVHICCRVRVTHAADVNAPAAFIQPAFVGDAQCPLSG